MIRAFSIFVFLLMLAATRHEAQAQELDRIEAMTMKHLGIEKLDPDAGIRLRSVLDRIRRADSEHLQTLYADIGRYRLGEMGYADSPKIPHPFMEIKDPRVRGFLEFMVEVADQLLRHQKRCEADFFVWFTLTMIDGLGRHYDEACEKRMMKEVMRRHGEYSWGQETTIIARRCYEQSANPEERKRLLADFAFMMDSVFTGNGILAVDYQRPNCKARKK